MAQVKEHITYFLKISASAAFTFVKINLLGFVSTLAVLIIGGILILLSNNNAHAGHVGGEAFLIVLFVQRPLGCILWLLLLSSPYLFFFLGNKYVVSKIINRIISDKAENYLYPLLDTVLQKFKEHQPELIKKGADNSLMKLKLIQEAKNNVKNKWIRRIIVFGVKKMQLDDIDFTQENVSFSDIIKTKIINTLNNISAPNKNIFWIIIGVQWLILLIIWLIPY
ncbi:MAG: hypothetical protein LBQ84_03205 [Flavobacteriaceae bacterium]|jgi:hypothetical protein|nr:hypothetical protein [Flavobacteriaceae bacterium]